MTFRARIALLLGATLLLVVAAGLLLRGRGAPDLVRGGRLLAMDLGTVERFQVTAGGVPYRFERLHDSLWTLSGAVTDWVDPLRLSQQLAILAGAAGGPVIAGSEPEDRRYEFNGPDAVRLALYGPGGAEERLLLGATNPVSGLVYASGAGRPGCFPVNAEVRDRLLGLPDAVRLGTLLPPVPVASLDRITVVKNRRTEVLARFDGRWWLRVPAADAPEVPPLVQDWQRLYDDRRRRDDEGLWLLADDRGVAGLAYEVGQLQVTRFVAPIQAAAALDQWELQPPLITVTLEGRGIEPDPTAGDADHLQIGFGMPLDANVVPAVRRGAPLLVPRQALTTLEAPVGDLLYSFAFTRRPLLADAIEIDNPSGPLLKARRVDRAHRNDERTQWDQVLPPPGRDEDREHLTARNTIVDMDRLAVLAVLPPTGAKRVLKDEERLVITLGREGQPDEVWHCGLIDPDHVPGGTERLAPTDDATGPVGLWRPADGRLLQVSPTLLLTARSLAAHQAP